MLQVFCGRLYKIQKLRFLIPNNHFYMPLNIARLIKKLIYSKKITKKIIIFEVLLVEKYQRFDQRFFIKNCKIILKA